MDVIETATATDTIMQDHIILVTATATGTATQTETVTATATAMVTEGAATIADANATSALQSCQMVCSTQYGMMDPTTARSYGSHGSGNGYGSSGYGGYRLRRRIRAATP